MQDGVGKSTFASQHGAVQFFFVVELFNLFAYVQLYKSLTFYKYNCDFAQFQQISKEHIQRHTTDRNMSSKNS